MLDPTNVAEVLSPTNRAFFYYWQSVAMVQRPSRKSAINPAAIPKIIPKLVIYERDAPTVFRVRLMGTHVAKRIGVDLTGRNLLEFFCYAAKAEAQRDLNRIVNEPGGQFLMVRDRFTTGREAWVEILRLPLTDEEGETRFIIGCTEEVKTTGWSTHERAEPELIAERIKGCFFDLSGEVHSDTVWTNADNAVPEGLVRS